MSTREDNLKKINLELEKLSDEDLDNVAGGTIGQTADDSVFLYKHGLMDTWHANLHMIFHWKSGSAEVDAGWSKAGITCVTKPAWGNQYFLNGKEISREEAIKIVEKNFPKTRRLEDSI